MKHFTHISDIKGYPDWIGQALELKTNPYAWQDLGKGKILVLLFFNSSLRTRLSTEIAAHHLGLHVITLNVNEAWQLEFDDGAVMNMNRAEHVKEAAQVISQYADIIGIRSFPTLENKSRDEAEQVINAFKKYGTVPVLNLESATGHPFQALADAITISEFSKSKRPKVVLSWAPHPRALPQSVANSFVQIMKQEAIDLVITHPEGYDLRGDISAGVPVIYDQRDALRSADFVYVKNWSSYNSYGTVLPVESDWMMTQEKLGEAYFMHCLPVRRNVVVEDAVLDSDRSLVIHQANNRTFAAQYILKQMLGELRWKG